MGLGIREARNSLPSLIKRAADGGEEIQLGSRGTDEVTLVATEKYRRIRGELDRLRAEVAGLKDRLKQVSERTPAGGQPFEGLQRALEDGRLAVGTASGPRARRYFEDYPTVSTSRREDRVRFGSETATPRHRRSGPRA